MLDLMKIATTEAHGGDLKTCLSELYSETDLRPKGYPNAIVGKVVIMIIKLIQYVTL